MKIISISKNNAGHRLDKLLLKYFDKGAKSFVYKMLRKKNITLNDCRAKGSEILSEGDIIKLWLSDETIEKFISKEEKAAKEKKSLYSKAGGKSISLKNLKIIYEDADILILDKPAGLLSQKAGPTDISLNDMLLAYIKEKEEGEDFYSPSICNRLDRNTSGLIICAKNYKAARTVNDLIKKREIKKYYLSIVQGDVLEKKSISAWLYKDEKSNTVIVRDKEFSGAKYIKTEYRPVYRAGGMSLIMIHLITGRSHQIRAHLAFLGHPLVGDRKYAKSFIGEQRAKTLENTAEKREDTGKKRKISPSKIPHQLLHAFMIRIPDTGGKLAMAEKKVFFAPLPHIFYDILPIDGDMEEDIRKGMYGNLEIEGIEGFNS